MTPLFDTHCHYNLEPFFSGKPSPFFAKENEDEHFCQWQDHHRRAQQQQVLQAVVVGVDLDSSRLAVSISEQEPQLYASIGICPTDLNQLDTKNLDHMLEELKTLSVAPKIVAVGEVGLDWTTDTSIKEKQIQEQLFVQQIVLANQLNKPLVIHARDPQNEAYQKILDLLEKEYLFQKPFVLHCVSGPTNYIKKAIKMGGYLSFAGNITYPNANHLRELFSLTPPDRVMIETDAPFLPPQEKRGMVNLPRYLRLTADFLATQLGVNLNQIYQNSCRCFGLNSQLDKIIKIN
ncbi:MAG TPA: TatD family hydrolase [Candidatus Woesebacteria bacterium]|nr:TatD family hydrolase [Candidatus Woesebacteria bacterium]